MSSIKLAIDNEYRERDFYLKEAKRSKNPVVIRLLETLAQEELDHANWIGELHGKLVKDGAWPQDVSLQMKDTTLHAELKKLDYRAEATSRHDDSDVACLKAAIDFEKDAADFYTEIAGRCDNPQEQKFFSFLSKVEHDHMVSIKDSLAYLEDPEAWFESSEHAGMDGA